VKLSLEDAKNYSWFAVFDGHGGSLVSTTSAASVLGKIMNTPEWKSDNRTIASISKALTRGFLEMDEDLRKVSVMTAG
jgi:serine/threonine protein phosphatase PrpC